MSNGTFRSPLTLSVSLCVSYPHGSRWRAWARSHSVTPRSPKTVPEPTIHSRFLKEVPRALLDPVRGDEGHVNLHAERFEVRETARRNLYTGKTYNSVENIKQFFSDRDGLVQFTLLPRR